MNVELARCAVGDNNAGARKFPERPHPYRTDFERDRDRITHCSAFRRLEGKTQVFTPGLDDHYRTRLTHSIEVALIGRTIAKALNLNQTLTEAVCLAHDLGHSPFGHTGEQILNELMKDFGGFEHNSQTIRIVELLEKPYSGFAGLNLTYHTRLALARHSTPYDDSHYDGFTEPNCSLEGQVADIADRIAYNSHDLEDGLRSRLINEQQLAEAALFAAARSSIRADSIDDSFIRHTRTAKAVIEILVSDCIDTGRKIIADSGVNSAGQVCHRPDRLIKLGEEAENNLNELEKFLFDNMYSHSQLRRTATDVRLWLTSIFEKFRLNPVLMPGYYRRLIPDWGLERVVCDYVSGMTDRYCMSLLKNI